MNNFEEIVVKEFLENNNCKIKEETLDEYLSSFKRDALTRLAITYVFVDKDYSQLLAIKNMTNKPKKYIINYIKENIEKIISTYILLFSKEEIEQLKTLIKENSTYHIYTMPFSLHFLDIIKAYSLAKIEYNKKDNTITTYVPKEFKDILNKVLKDKETIAKSKKYDEIMNYLKTVISTYGIIELTKLHEIFEKQMYKIDIEELNHIIEMKCILDDISTYMYGNEKIICEVDFMDEDDAILFYYNQTQDYKEFSKSDYKLIYEGKYLDNLNSYKKMKKYLCEHYIGIEKEFDFIKEMIIHDYICSAQLSQEQADRDFLHKIKDILETNQNEITKLLVMMRDIYKEYPKWSKRGNI